uniref:Uncharacterized protein n=1 Tax=Candidatus Desulfatibia profunda TaxID=2841695 RepID=A0A8J6NRB9_9BACT|nr:hypothetical protein [Candidatus Desulfatibia profunda]
MIDKEVGSRFFLMKKDTEIKNLTAKLRNIESDYVYLGALMDAVGLALDGEEPSDFMLSFPIVRRVYDLVLSKNKEVL